jgi:hypothetical protein
MPSSVGAAYHVHQFRDFPALAGLVARRDRVLDVVAQDFLLEPAQRAGRRDLPMRFGWRRVRLD